MEGVPRVKKPFKLVTKSLLNMKKENTDVCLRIDRVRIQNRGGKRHKKKKKSGVSQADSE